MSVDAFRQGWVMLLAQPYAKDYCFDAAKETVQRNLYAKALEKFPADQLLAVVWWWVQHETKWPLIADLKFHLGRMFPPAKHEPLTKRDLLEAPTDPSTEPWQSIMKTWVSSNGSNIFEIGVPIIQEYLQRHPHDLVVKEKLAAWEEILERPRECSLT